MPCKMTNSSLAASLKSAEFRVLLISAECREPLNSAERRGLLWNEYRGVLCGCALSLCLWFEWKVLPDGADFLCEKSPPPAAAMIGVRRLTSNLWTAPDGRFDMRYDTLSVISLSHVFHRGRQTAMPIQTTDVVASAKVQTMKIHASSEGPSVSQRP